MMSLVNATAGSGMWWTFIGRSPEYLKWLKGHPDDFVIISERLPRATHVILHRSTCRTVRAEALDTGGRGLGLVRVCGRREVLEDQFEPSEVQSCERCLRDL